MFKHHSVSLYFKGDDVPESEITETFQVEDGDAFTLKCVTDGNFTDPVHISKNGAKEEQKREHVDESFNFIEDTGLYECSANHAHTGKEHYRRVRIMPMIKLSNLPACTSEDSKKCSGNPCVLVRNTPTCYHAGVHPRNGCPVGKVGANCQENLLTDYVRMETYQATAVGVSGFVMAACIVAAILGVLFFKEKRRVGRYVNYYGQLPETDAYGDLIIPENPYQKMVSTNRSNQPTRTDSLRNAFRLPKSRPRPVEVAEPLPLIDQSKLPHIPPVS